MKKLCLILAVLLCLPVSAFAKPKIRQDVVIIEQRVVESGYFPNIVLVPSAQLGVPYYYQVNVDSLRGRLDPALIEAIADRTSDKVLEKLLAALEIPAGEPDPNVEDPNWDPENPEGNPAPDVPAIAPDDLELGITALLSNKCGACHANGNMQGGLSLIENGTLTVTDRASRWDIFDVVQTGKMPKNGEPLSDAEVELIRQWARVK